MENFYAISDETKAEILKYFNTDESRLKRDVYLLKQWLKKQPHLPQNVLTDRELENILVRNKCRIERTKEAIDNYFTLKGIYPEHFDFGQLVPSKHSAFFAPLAELVDGERVYFCKLIREDHVFLDYSPIVAAFLELELHYNYCKGFKLVFDWDGYTFNHLRKVTPMQIYQFLNVVLDCYATRISAILYINVPNFVGVALKLMKPVLKPKLYSRIHLYNTPDDFFKEFPRKIFFRDYGGEYISLGEALDFWDEVFDDHRAFFLKKINAKSDESLRIGKCKYSELHEIHGTFRTINEMD